MCSNKEICLECWGYGVVSWCCGAEIMETPNGKYKCSHCGEFCKVEECESCGGESYVSEDE